MLTFVCELSRWPQAAVTLLARSQGDVQGDQFCPSKTPLVVH